MNTQETWFYTKNLNEVKTTALYLTHCALGEVVVILMHTFQMHFSDHCIEHFLWKVNIGLDYGLMPSGT